MQKEWVEVYSIGKIYYLREQLTLNISAFKFNLLGVENQRAHQISLK